MRGVEVGPPPSADTHIPRHERAGTGHVDFFAIIRAVRRRWVIVVVATVVGVVLGAGSVLLSSAATPTGPSRAYYKATNIQVANVNPLSTTGRVVNLDQLALMVVTGDVPTRAGAALGIDSKELLGVLSISTDETTRTLSITAVDRDPATAVAIADGVADELSKSATEAVKAQYAEETAVVNKRIDQLKGQMTVLEANAPGAGASSAEQEAWRAQINVLSAQLSRAYGSLVDLADAGDPSSPLRLLGAAEAREIGSGDYNAIRGAAASGDQIVRKTSDGEAPVSTTASSVTTRLDDPITRGLVGGLLGLFVGVVIAFGLTQTDRRLWTRDSVEEAFDLPVLADIATFRGDHDDEEDAVVVHTEPMSGAAEGYRAVRSILQFLCSDTLHAAPHSGPATRILVVSSTPGEGKSTTTANVAAAFAESGLRVLALNADFRRPRLHRLFGVADASPNLISTAVADVTLLGNVPGSSGSKPSEVVGRQRRALMVARDHFDVIIVDTAPLLSTNDALDLVKDVEVVIVVARYGHTTGSHARRVAELLRRVGAPAVGVVSVGAPNDLRDTAYYYPYDSSASRASYGEPPHSVSAPTSGGTASAHASWAAPGARTSVKQLLARESTASSAHGSNGNGSNGNNGNGAGDADRG